MSQLRFLKEESRMIPVSVWYILEESILFYSFRPFYFLWQGPITKIAEIMEMISEERSETVVCFQIYDLMGSG